MLATASFDQVLIGGLGHPYDDLIAARLESQGASSKTLGEFDADALARGRRVLPKGQCAPALYTTGALLRAASQAHASDTLAFVSPQSCGPCRYALFADAWRRSLRRSRVANVSVLGLDHSPESLPAFIDSELGQHVVQCLAIGDALTATFRRLLPLAERLEQLEGSYRNAARDIAKSIAAGATPFAALHEARSWHREVAFRHGEISARVGLVGDPWALHVDGDGQVNAPRRLALLGIETVVPPSLLWLAYQLWLAPLEWGQQRASREVEKAADTQLHRLQDALATAHRAAEIPDQPIPAVAELARLASPFIAPTLRGGYGFIEVGLALRYAMHDAMDGVLSLKSFGCVPSVGVSDAVMPSALRGAVPFLSIEVTGDPSATRESRLMLFAANAIDHRARSGARAELALHAPELR